MLERNLMHVIGDYTNTLLIKVVWIYCAYIHLKVKGNKNEKNHLYSNFKFSYKFDNSTLFDNFYAMVKFNQGKRTITLNIMH